MKEEVFQVIFNVIRVTLFKIVTIIVFDKTRTFGAVECSTKIVLSFNWCPRNVLMIQLKGKNEMKMKTNDRSTTDNKWKKERHVKFLDKSKDAQKRKSYYTTKENSNTLKPKEQ